MLPSGCWPAKQGAIRTRCQRGADRLWRVGETQVKDGSRGVLRLDAARGDLSGMSGGGRLDLFTRCFGLTRRQRRLLELAAGGLDTAAMAAALRIIPYTVQDQFKGAAALKRRGPEGLGTEGT